MKMRAHEKLLLREGGLSVTMWAFSCDLCGVNYFLRSVLVAPECRLMFGQAPAYKSCSWMMRILNRNNVAAKSCANTPADKYPHFPLRSWHGVEVVSTMEQPGQETREPYAPGLEGPPSDTKRRKRS